MLQKIKGMTDTNLLLSITIIVFFIMYLSAVLFLGEGFAKPQTFFNILNAKAFLIILSCGMSLVMITGGIDISVGSLIALDCMFLAVGMERWGMSAPLLCVLVLVIGIVFGKVYGAVLL